MDQVALDVLRDYHQQQLQANRKAGAAGLVSRGQAPAESANQAAVGDLFCKSFAIRHEPRKKPMNSTAVPNTVETTRARTRATPKNRMQTRCIREASRCKRHASRMGAGKTPMKTTMHRFNRVSTKEKEKNKKNIHPLCPPHVDCEAETTKSKLVEGVVEDDEFTVPTAQPGKPIPADWTAEAPSCPKTLRTWSPANGPKANWNARASSSWRTPTPMTDATSTGTGHLAYG
jgi:hypothetical protein